MFYYSLKNKFHKVSFKDAVMQGVANDGGLFFPNKINKLERSIITNIDDISNEEIAYQCLRQFVDSEIPNEVLNSIIHEAYKLPISMVDISKNISVLGISFNFIAGLVNLFGPKISGPAFFENTGSVIIVFSPNFIRYVA